MSKELRPDGIRPRITYTHELPNGIALLAEVGLCVFMYPGYPLQLTVTMKRNGKLLEGNATVADCSLNAKTATPADVARLLATVRTVPCKRCSAAAFDPKAVKTNRGGLCESCFVSDLHAELAKELEVENRRIARRDKRMKAKGMKYRVTAWVHSDEGDDYEIEWFFVSRPTRKTVQAYLMRERSAVLDDYEVVAI